MFVVYFFRLAANLTYYMNTLDGNAWIRRAMNRYITLKKYEMLSFFLFVSFIEVNFSRKFHVLCAQSKTIRAAWSSFNKWYIHNGGRDTLTMKNAMKQLRRKCSCCCCWCWFFCCYLLFCCYVFDRCYKFLFHRINQRIHWFRIALP